MAAAEQSFLISFSGELSAKGRLTRASFVKRLIANLRDALEDAGLAGRFEQRWSRLLLHAPAVAAPTIARVMGVNAVARAHVRPWDTIEDLCVAGEEIFAPEVRGRRFAVRVGRGERKDLIPFRAAELEAKLGAVLLPGAAGVDLRRPEIEARVELEGRKAWFFSSVHAGPGGLPIGTGGRALVLLSGGFDSAVAAWLMLRRGLRLDYLLCNSGGDDHLAQVWPVFEVLARDWSFGTRPRFFEADFRAIRAEIEARVAPALFQVVLKRQMARAAQTVARRLGAAALVTGDALGQVSSQTLLNLATIDRVVDLPILRPLLGASKNEILERARSIGTFAASERVPELCSLGTRVETHARATALEAAEAKLDLELITRSTREARIHSLDRPPLNTTRLEVDDVPPAARLIDLRPARKYVDWHAPEAENWPYAEALLRLDELDPAQQAVFVCEIGWKSDHLATLARARGFEAHALKGGVATLRALQDPALQALMSVVALND